MNPIIVPGKHLVDKKSSVGIDSVHSYGGALAKTRVISPDLYMRVKQ